MICEINTEFDLQKSLHIQYTQQDYVTHIKSATTVVKYCFYLSIYYHGSIFYLNLFCDLK